MFFDWMVTGCSCLLPFFDNLAIYESDFLFFNEKGILAIYVCTFYGRGISIILGETCVDFVILSSDTRRFVWWYYSCGRVSCSNVNEERFDRLTDWGLDTLTEENTCTGLYDVFVDWCWSLVFDYLDTLVLFIDLGFVIVLVWLRFGRGCCTVTISSCLVFWSKSFD